ncbi:MULTISPECIES: ribosome biogenesis GTPase YqeH [Priestia]|uniref:GTP-binding protein n=3 Tax=Priestia TaxID=2800373 RepID=D5DSX7_PRIM1|nr:MULTISPECIES: ribosome biogenesis GTPase YqeH [Priestia]AVX10465.1 ribosome biogenesis GTPase YqeH [Bacillus sp. Y-01]KOP76545.1 GTPase [Bacillus sp. FJAT-21351]KQU14517.1 ribosome biogenesis GTPase YqeH [Bacillus sp. Leaf75]KRD92441.1 ribosome biogenesis GTPase YqeH [Bacillus sp. Root239]KRF57847.1 ribosome biogenesis GTPase YqeH [Bacillus sp. Soil531]MBZ5477917.1 ribosome biogenesis GTPase YqeH [Bacillus sp. T_4]MCF6798457.1 ribosome biogenesis GTPase YqeH [Bacillus sp. ET1]MDH6652401.
MSEEKLQCVGCGVEIQTERPDELGYAPKSALEKEAIICQRCFRLKHYNEVQDVSLTDDDFLKILNGIGQTDGLVVKVVDIFDFNGSWLPGLHRFVGNNKVLLVGNKADLLPKSIKKNKLIHWMKREAKELGLKSVDVFLMSAQKGQGIREIAEAIEHYREGKDVYVVGCTNVGKSTFINAIIKEVTGEKDIITTSQYPGTTLDMIDIPLDNGASLYDTPGIINHHQMAHYVDKRDLKLISPKKEIKPKVYQLNEGQTLYFGGLARLDYVQGGRKSLTCYVSNDLHIHRTKLEKADELYEKQAGELLQPPRPEQMDEFPELVAHEFTIKNEKTDIVFSGLGWVTVNESGSKVVAHAPKGVGVFVRDSLI